MSSNDGSRKLYKKTKPVQKILKINCSFFRGTLVTDKKQYGSVGIDFNWSAYWMGDALITEDGEAIEEEALDGLTVIGPVTALINAVDRGDSCPAI